MTTQDIREQKFDKAAFGYKAEEVDQFLEQVCAYLEGLEGEKKVMEKKMAVLAEKIEEYRKDEDSMKEALIGAQRLGQNVVAEAKQKAEELLTQSKAQAETILTEAKNKANQSVDNIKVQVEREEKNLQRMQKEVSAFKSKLLNIYKSHLDLITSLPEVEEEKKPAFAPKAPAEDPQPEQEKQESPKVEAAPAEEPVPVKNPAETRKPGENTFESKFGELKFGKNFKRD